VTDDAEDDPVADVTDARHAPVRSQAGLDYYRAGQRNRIWSIPTGATQLAEKESGSKFVDPQLAAANNSLVHQLLTSHARYRFSAGIG
jgi:hypothetical protein